MSKTLSSILLLLFVFGLTFAQPAAAQPGECDPEAVFALVAYDLNGAPVSTSNPRISGDGRYVIYTSNASNIVPDDLNNTYDIFIYDREDCSTRRVSVTTEGQEANDMSFPLAYADNGRYLLLYSYATNLHPDYSDNSDQGGLFLLDLESQIYEYIDLYYVSNPDISGDGRYVVYSSRTSTTPIQEVLYVYDRQTQQRQRIMEAPEEESSPPFHFLPGISDDGAYIAFSTNAPTLFVADTNEVYDVFLYEQATGNYQLISTSSGGLMGDGESIDWPTLSADGRYIVFQSWAGNLVPDDTEGTNDVFLYDRITDEIRCITVNVLGQCGRNGHAVNYKTSLSADGRYVLYHQDIFSPHHSDTHTATFIYDRMSDETKLISLTPEGQFVVTFLQDFVKSEYLSSDGRFAVLPLTDGLYVADWQQLPQLPGSEPDAAPVRNHFDETAPILTWAEVTWAAGYEIQIDDNANFSSPEYSTVVGADVLEIPLPGADLTYGVHYWRVRAQRSNGSWGAWSAADQFAYRIYEWE